MIGRLAQPVTFKLVWYMNNRNTNRYQTVTSCCVTAWLLFSFTLFSTLCAKAYFSSFCTGFILIAGLCDIDWCKYRIKWWKIHGISEHGWTFFHTVYSLALINVFIMRRHASTIPHWNNPYIKCRGSDCGKRKISYVLRMRLLDLFVTCTTPTYWFDTHYIQSML